MTARFKPEIARREGQYFAFVLDEGRNVYVNWPNGSAMKAAGHDPDEALAVAKKRAAELEEAERPVDIAAEIEALKKVEEVFARLEKQNERMDRQGCAKRYNDMRGWLDWARQRLEHDPETA